jgi:hypothetical protein
LRRNGATGGNDRNFDYGFTMNDVGVIRECSKCEVQEKMEASGSSESGAYFMQLNICC